MLRHILASLSILAAAATAPVAAQGAARPIAHPSAVAQPGDPAAAGATRIFTLAWTEVRLPAALSESSTPAPGPSGLEARRIYTLTWQSLPGEPVAVHPARPVGSESCRIMTLVAEPCR